MSRRTSWSTLIVVVAVCAATYSCARAITTASQPTATGMSGLRPGDIIQSEPMPAPSGAFARKVLYVSTGLSGENIAVSGIVVASRSSRLKTTALAAGRPVVAWAHPTTGVATGCAPSSRSDVFDTIPGLATMLDRGYVVAATDYPGLGTTGPHPYLVGISEARAVIDSVRAARNLPGTNASSRFAVWGHSQGGHAALFVGELAASYAPELTLKGVAAAAPATELARQFRDNLYTVGGRLLGAYAVWSWSRVYGVAMRSVVGDRDARIVDRVAGICIQTNPQFLRAGVVLKALSRDWLPRNVFEMKRWDTLFADNTPTTQPRGEPLYLAQGSDDGLVGPAVTAGYAANLCRHGVIVDFIKLVGVEHHPAGMESGAGVADWIAGRFQDKPAPSTCAVSATK